MGGWGVGGCDGRLLGEFRSMEDSRDMLRGTVDSLEVIDLGDFGIAINGVEKGEDTLTEAI